MGTPSPISSGGGKDWVEQTWPWALVATEVGLPSPQKGQQPPVPHPPPRGASHSLLPVFAHSALFQVVCSRKLSTDISTSGILVPVSVDIDS